MKGLISFFLVYTLFILGAHSCVHDTLNIPLAQIEVEHSGQRFLQTQQPIRIIVDYSQIADAPASIQTFLQNQLMPAAISYFRTTLSVTPISSLKISLTQSTVCGYPIPDQYRTGVNADLVIFVDGGTSTGSFLAWAKPCLLSAIDKRPLFGQIYFNFNSILPQNDADFENSLTTTLHELTHVLGFSQSLYPYFPSQPTLGSKMVNGQIIQYIDIAPLTAKLRTYFNCPTLVGAYLENEGDAMNTGSHFERRIFYVEYMTASALNDLRMTEFTLALLEGSGWYGVNYSMAEPTYWGKGRGCNFLDTPCINKVTLQPNFPEFCSPLTSTGICQTGRSGGYCATVKPTTSTTLLSSYNYWNNNTVVLDQFADNCAYIRPYSNQDCQDASLQSSAIISAEVFGPGSMAFTGTIYPTGPLTKSYPYCFQYQCMLQTNGVYYLKIFLGTGNSATCTTKSSITVNGYYGKLDCPEPNFFCKTWGVKYCKRGCMGNGVCNSQTGVCTCNEGWRGADCGIKLKLAL
jgi:leishmanolysin